MLQTLKSLLKRRGQKPRPEVTRVQAFDGGFEAFWGGVTAAFVKWPEVRRIFTYKVDCFAYDVIFLAFGLRGHEEVLEISEEAEGFQELMSALGKAFPEVNPDWYFNVMRPAFAENLTVLFEREGEA